MGLVLSSLLPSPFGERSFAGSFCSQGPRLQGPKPASALGTLPLGFSSSRPFSCMCALVTVSSLLFGFGVGLWCGPPRYVSVLLGLVCFVPPVVPGLPRLVLFAGRSMGLVRFVPSTVPGSPRSVLFAGRSQQAVVLPLSFSPFLHPMCVLCLL